MSVYKDKKTGRYVFEFDAIIKGRRIRTRKQLPKAWNKNEANAYARQETATAYASATGLVKKQWTVCQAVEYYIEYRVPDLKHGRDYANELNVMNPYYVGRPLSEMAQVCQEYQRTATKEDGSKLAPATIKNRIRYLTSAARYAWKHHNACETDPAARVTVPQVRNERSTYIDRRQMLTLCLMCANRQTRSLIRIGFYSGMRFSEIIKARVSDGNFVLYDTKNGDQRVIPIHPKIKNAMPDRWQSEFKLMYWFRIARKKAGMEWLHFHDIRHACASAMIQDGVDLNTVGAVLGHRSGASTRRYAHLATDNLKAAIGRIGRKAT